MNINTGKIKPHGKDLRKGRYSENSRVYLVTTVTYQRQKVFTDFYRGRVIVQSLLHQHQQQRIDSLAFVIMPDHFHWLFALKNDWTLAKVMQRVKGSSAFQIKKIRREQNRTSVNMRLWQAGYHDHALRKKKTCSNVLVILWQTP